MMRIKKGDTVVVVSGKDKGKKGKVLVVNPESKKVLVEGIAMVTKHQKPSAKVQQGGIIHKEAFVDMSNVMPFCKKCDKGVRVKFNVLENGSKVKACAKCGEEL